jgi:hypothetical protein
VGQLLLGEPTNLPHGPNSTPEVTTPIEQLRRRFLHIGNAGELRTLNPRTLSSIRVWSPAAPGSWWSPTTRQRG